MRPTYLNYCEDYDSYNAITYFGKADDSNQEANFFSIVKVKKKKK